MLRLLLLVLPIALIDGISPARIGTMVVLLGTRRPWRRACSFLAGSFVGYLLLGIVITVGADRLIDYLAAEPRPIVYGGSIAIGALLVFVGARHLRTGRKATVFEVPRVRGPGGALLLSLVLTVVTAPAALPYLAAIDLILQSGIDELQILGLLAAYCIVYLVPMAGLVFLHFILGLRSADFLSRIQRTVSTLVPRAFAVLLLILGALMIAEGVAFFFDEPLFPVPAGS